MRGLTNIELACKIGTDSNSYLRIGTRKTKASHAPSKRVFSCHFSYGGAYWAASAGRFLCNGSSNPVRPRHPKLELWAAGLSNSHKGARYAQTNADSYFISVPLSGRTKAGFYRVPVRHHPEGLTMKNNIVSFPGCKKRRGVLRGQQKTIIEAYFTLPEEEQRAVARDILGRAFLNSMLEKR